MSRSFRIRGRWIAGYLWGFTAWEWQIGPLWGTVPYWRFIRVGCWPSVHWDPEWWRKEEDE